MQTIFKKFLGPTNVRGSRVKASASGWPGKPGMSVILSYDHVLNGDENRRAAAQALATKLKWAGVWAEGADRGGGYVYVNVGHASVTPKHFTVPA